MAQSSLILSFDHSKMPVVSSKVSDTLDSYRNSTRVTTQGPLPGIVTPRNGVIKDFILSEESTVNNMDSLESNDKL